MPFTVGTGPTLLTVTVPPRLSKPRVRPTVARQWVEVLWTQTDAYGQQGSLMLLDLQGRRLWHRSLSLDPGVYRWTVPLEGLPPGVYLLHFRIPPVLVDWGLYTPEVNATYKILKPGNP